MTFSITKIDNPLFLRKPKTLFIIKKNTLDKFYIYRYFENNTSYYIIGFAESGPLDFEDSFHTPLILVQNNSSFAEELENLDKTTTPTKKLCDRLNLFYQKLHDFSKTIKSSHHMENTIVSYYGHYYTPLVHHHSPLTKTILIKGFRNKYTDETLFFQVSKTEKSHILILQNDESNQFLGPGESLFQYQKFGFSHLDYILENFKPGFKNLQENTICEKLHSLYWKNTSEQNQNTLFEEHYYTPEKWEQEEILQDFHGNSLNERDFKDILYGYCIQHDIKYCQILMNSNPDLKKPKHGTLLYKKHSSFLNKEKKFQTFLSCFSSARHRGLFFKNFTSFSRENDTLLEIFVEQKLSAHEQIKFKKKAKPYLDCLNPENPEEPANPFE